MRFWRMVNFPFDILLSFEVIPTAAPISFSSSFTFFWSGFLYLRLGTFSGSQRPIRSSVDITSSPSTLPCKGGGSVVPYFH